MKNSILKYSIYIIAALTIFSCQKENKPEVKPEKKEVKPTSTAQCISTELKALKELVEKVKGAQRVKLHSLMSIKILF